MHENWYFVNNNEYTEYIELYTSTYAYLFEYIIITLNHCKIGNRKQKPNTIIL